MSNIALNSSGLGKTFDISFYFNQQSPLPFGCEPTCSIGDTCGGTLSGSELSIIVSNPWTITAREDVQTGYDKTACYRCTSGSYNFDETFQII